MTLEFQAVHERFRPRIHRYLTRLVGEADAEDMTQLVMLKVSEKLAEFRGESNISTWIYRIATNAALDKLRGRANQPVADVNFDSALDEDLPPGMQDASAEKTAIREEMNACIREFIERLPEAYKTVMVLSELEGFQNAEIAAILGISVDTVKIRLHRAREKLRKDLGAGCTFYRDECDELACDRKSTATIVFRPRR